MADENVIIEENEQNVGEYDPNPYDNVTVEEALKQLFNRFTPRTVRQAIFTMAENNKPATLIEKTVTSNDTYVATDDDADGYSKVTVDVPSGGGETFEVEMTLNSSGTAFAASKTLQETIDAIKAGKQIDFSLTYVGAESKVFCYGVADTGVMEIILMMMFDGTTLYSIYWTGDEDGTAVTQIPMIIAGTSP